VRWSSTGDEQRPDPEAHEEQATEPVDEVDPLAHPRRRRSVRVEDADGDDRDEAVEQVELRRVDLLDVDQGDAEDRLDEDRDLGDDREPPQRAGA
jgi:hypothetical protein